MPRHRTTKLARTGLRDSAPGRLASARRVVFLRVCAVGAPLARRAASASANDESRWGIPPSRGGCGCAERGAACPHACPRRLQRGSHGDCRPLGEDAGSRPVSSMDAGPPDVSADRALPGYSPRRGRGTRRGCGRDLRHERAVGEWHERVQRRHTGHLARCRHAAAPPQRARHRGRWGLSARAVRARRPDVARRSSSTREAHVHLCRDSGRRHGLDAVQIRHDPALNYPPFGGTTAQAAFEKYLGEGKGGWVGLHHASLYGPEVTPDNEKPWVGLQSARPDQLRKLHRVLRRGDRSPRRAGPSDLQGCAPRVPGDERRMVHVGESPRPHVRVLANVDESSYKPPSNIKMGDHPVIWTNEDYKGRNLYSSWAITRTCSKIRRT